MILAYFTLFFSAALASSVNDELSSALHAYTQNRANDVDLTPCEVSVHLASGKEVLRELLDRTTTIQNILDRITSFPHSQKKLLCEEQVMSPVQTIENSPSNSFTLVLVDVKDTLQGFAHHVLAMDFEDFEIVPTGNQIRGAFNFERPHEPNLIITILLQSIKGPRALRFTAKSHQWSYEGFWYNESVSGLVELWNFDVESSDIKISHRIEGNRVEVFDRRWHFSQQFGHDSDTDVYVHLNQ